MPDASGALLSAKGRKGGVWAIVGWRLPFSVQRASPLNSLAPWPPISRLNTSPRCVA
jgi:hypothetical protein